MDLSEPPLLSVTSSQRPPGINILVVKEIWVSWIIAAGENVKYVEL